MHIVELAAPLTTGSELRDWVLIVCGNVLAIFLAVRGIGYLIKREYGEMATFIVAAIFVGALVYAPDSAKDVLTGIWNKVVSN